MYDGTEFLGVDATATADDKPADTVLTHYLVNGLRFNERGYDRAGGGLLLRSGDPTVSSGVKTGKLYGGVNEMAIRVVPLYLDRIASRVVVDFWIPYGLLGRLSAQLDLEEFGGRASTQGTFNRRWVRLTIETPGLTRPQSGMLMLTWQSTDVIDVTAQSNILTANNESEVIVNLGSGGLYSNDPADFPAFAGAQALGRDNLNSFIALDHVLALDADTAAVTGSEMPVVGGVAYSLYNISTIQPAAYAVQVGYSDDYFDGSELRANIPEFSDVNRRIVAIQERQYRRPVLLSTGGQGRYRTDGNWPDAYRSDWEYVDGDAASPVELMRQSHDYVAGLSTIEVYPALMGVHLVDPPISQTPFIDELSDLWEQRTLAQWTLTLKVEQYQDGSGTPVEIDSRSRVVGIPHLPASALIKTPALHQAYLQRFFAAGEDYQFTHTEGRLQDLDFAAINDLVMTLTVDTTTLDVDKPFDVVLLAEFNSGFTPEYNTTQFRGWGGATKVAVDEYDDPEYLRLTLLYHSTYARRE